MMKPFFLIAALTCMPQVKNHNLIGEWRSSGKNITRTILQFTKNGHFTVATGAGQLENEGSYRIQNDTFYMQDGNCGLNTTGTYALHFFTEDSVQFHLVTDKCTERSSEINGGIIVRNSH